MIPFIRKGGTTSLTKRGQVLGYATLTGDRKMKLDEIALQTGVPKSTCSNLINKAKEKSLKTGNPDLWANENLGPDPNWTKGSNKALRPDQERALIALALSNATHCRMPLSELAAEAGLNIGINTVKETLAADGIYRRKPTKKPWMNEAHKGRRLAFCLANGNCDLTDVVFTDESYS